MDNPLTTFQIILDRILARPKPHTSGPKRPSLAQIESGERK